MIQFQEHTETGYAMRTWDNARLSDLTIAFAIDFNTGGELLTRKAAYGKYKCVPITNMIDSFAYLDDLCRYIKSNRCEKLNIAGNGIYNLNGKYNQQEIDGFMIQFIESIIYRLTIGNRISIRSGGQTGVDEAALKAGDKLGLETICLAPRGWMFRDINGVDICNQALFLKRFGPQYDITDIL